VDLIASGVIAPAKVARSAIESAASVVSLLLVTEALVSEEQPAQPGAIIAPGYGDLAEGMARPTSDAATPV
jgi:chaperonin GroEL